MANFNLFLCFSLLIGLTKGEGRHKEDIWKENIIMNEFAIILHFRKLAEIQNSPKTMPPCLLQPILNPNNQRTMVITEWVL